MTSKEFIISRLKVLSMTMPELSIKYRFEEADLMHCVEIKPKSIFDYNPEYLNFEEDLYLGFIGCYPEQSLYFITEGALSPITCTDYESVDGYYNTIDKQASFQISQEIVQVQFDQTYLGFGSNSVPNLADRSRSNTLIHAGEENYALAA